MTLSADELEIVDYLRSWKGDYVSLAEICRCAGGRRKFKESPIWANSLMTRLVELELIQVNDRGHYRSLVEGDVPDEDAQAVRRVGKAMIVGDDYFPASSWEEYDETQSWTREELEAVPQESGDAVEEPTKSGTGA